jgi:hypothetical protein
MVQCRINEPEGWEKIGYFVLGESLVDLFAGPQDDYSPRPGGGAYTFQGRGARNEGRG